MKQQKIKNIVLVTIFMIVFFGIGYNLYVLIANNEKFLNNSKYSEIIKKLDDGETSYIGIRTDSLFNNIETGIVWVRSIMECSACVESQEIIIKKIKEFNNINFYLYFDGFDSRSSKIMALNYGFENNLINKIDNLNQYIKHTPLLLLLYKKQIILSNIGYKETQERTLAFWDASKRYLKNISG